MGNWVEGFVDEFADTIFGGDAVFVCGSGALLVNHEGMYAKVAANHQQEGK
jgi:hypothetical protein